MVVDDVKVQLMAVSDRLNALTEYLVADTRSVLDQRSIPNPCAYHGALLHTMVCAQAWPGSCSSASIAGNRQHLTMLFPS